MLSDHIDLVNDTKAKHVETDGRMATIEDKARLGGKSDILFVPDTFELKQWTVIEPQGLRTFALDLVGKPAPA